MFAVIESGGKQYKVSEGETIRIEKLNGNPGQNIEFDKVLLLNKDDQVNVGSPNLSNVKVSGEIISNGRAKKVVTFKLKRRKRYRRKIGHRQYFVDVKINSIKI